MKIRNLIYQISFTSILSALVFIATVFISIPYAGGAGYFNLSDALILFSCAYFGPTVGLLSGILGCSLGDLFLGYASCIPFTIFAKGIEAVAFIFLFYFVKNTKFLKLFAFIIAPLFMVLGYIPYYLIYDDGQGALALIASLYDIVQAISGASVGFILYLAFERIKLPYGYEKNLIFSKKK